MKFSLSHLKEFLETSADLHAIAEALTRCGLETEEISDPAESLGQFQVALIETTEKHPDADRLKICKVRTDTGILQIVCGAANARAGLKVCLALPGFYVPGLGITLKKGEIRGVESQGMLCSLEELGLPQPENAPDGIAELPVDAPVGARVIDILGMNDPVIEISVTPDKAYALGVAGVARDLASAGFGIFKKPVVPEAAGSFPCPIRVISETENCPHFVGVFIKGVKNGVAPQMIRDRLKAAGMKSVSALVDVTNYISLTYNRPLHVFDFDKLKGDLIVRQGKAEKTVKRTAEEQAAAGTETRFTELFETLDGSFIDPGAEIVVIADQNSIVSQAGVSGGRASGCTEETVNVFLESALFTPESIAISGRATRILSEARRRFERGVDPEFTEAGAKIAAQMIVDFCGGEISEFVYAGSAPDLRKKITLPADLAMKITGCAVALETQKDILEKLGFEPKTVAGGLECYTPSFRHDVSRAEDLVEEIIRIYGVNAIPSLPFPSREPVKLSPERLRIRALRETAVNEANANECVTYRFIQHEQAKRFQAPDAPLIRLANPISSEADTLRPSLLPGLLAALQRNKVRSVNDLCLFEVGRVFYGRTDQDQHSHAAILRAGSMSERHWAEKSRSVDVYDAKADALALLAAAGAPVSGLNLFTEETPPYYHPGRSAALRLGKVTYARFGEIHPEIVDFYGLSRPVAACEIFMNAVPYAKAKKSTSRPEFAMNLLPDIKRDFSFIIRKELQAEEICAAIRKNLKQNVRNISIFDVFSGKDLPENQKSVAISVLFTQEKKTYTDSEIETLSAQVVDSVAKHTGALLRDGSD